MGQFRNRSDVCILGAGPHGLAAAAHLRQADPDIELTVLDPSGSWLSTWRQQFANAEIATLRSPVVHHPSSDPFALADFINRNALPTSGMRYNLPLADVFEQFCDALIDDLALEDPLAVTPRNIRSDGREVTLEIGDDTLVASHLVVASNPHQRPIPDWVWPVLGSQPGMVANAYDVDLSALDDLSGQRVAVVGGGLTAAHLALGAASRGAEVHLISREKLRVQEFDTAPGWLGPKFLDAFFAETDPSRRLAMAERARAGGTVPPWMHERLTELAAEGVVRLCESTVVRNAQLTTTSRCALTLSSETELQADRVWLATGTLPDAQALRCIRPLLADVAEIRGYPLLDDQLRIGPHPAHLMGRLAMAQLGPAAGNLWGAQRGAHRITKAITGIDLEAQRVVPSANSSSKP